MIIITKNISIGENEIQEDFIRASGPGGQRVNKVSTAVQIRFDVAGSPSLPEDVRQRLLRIAGHRVSNNGILTIDARRFRSQIKNRQDAMERLKALIRKAVEKPRPRHKTRPTRASMEKRLQSKHRHSKIKRTRGPVSDRID